MRAEEIPEKDFFLPPKGSVIIRSGRVIDPANGVDEVCDLALYGGRVAGRGKALPWCGASKVIDAEGLIVTPGVVDIHSHLFATGGNPNAWAGEYSVFPDGFSFRSGVTAMVDAGSAGWRNFDLFRVSVIDRAKTRVFSFLNIASFGMVSDIMEQHAPDFDPKTTAAKAEKHRDVIVGIKSAHYRHPGWESVDRAVEAGELSGLPVMVDFGYFMKERPYWRLVTEKLRKGDISTHCYRGPVPVVDENGTVYPYLFEARERGVLFDLGHGGGSFLFRNAVPAFAQGFYPDSISSDLHVLSMNAAMMDMPTTMSKCLAMGMPIGEVIARSTAVPARMIGHPELGHLSPGAPGDVTLWNLREGTFGFKDSVGGRLRSNRRFECEMTILGGDVVWDLNARDGVEYGEIPFGEGIREGEFFIPPER
ncbi:amidohydrolase/deacetylase family metallohydrolase [Aminivibrio sp.]|uniref:amidohydrolase/deacetylase family metallohydrolase n=1 Tax=Aminivibrio sp. TaxID=1872489 RepID=UPI001A3E9B6F|nr:amidohydrolase/deacetylase family metallohydrolase [Aminivibrio sp.]MBL3538275.1 amidohydrolase/deacetylase family metallohydrolase [Aminivibrio sp.]